MKKILPLFVILSVSLYTSISRADDFNAVQSGNWSDTNTWVNNDMGTNAIPGANDSADIPAGFNVTVNTNESIGWIYDSGTVTMGTNSSLSVFTDSSIGVDTTLIATNHGNTVIYLCNPFFAKVCDYYNFVLNNTNVYSPPTNMPFQVHFQDFNNFNNNQLTLMPTPMHIGGDWTLIGAIKVQQGTDNPGLSQSADITIDGNLIIGAGCIWDTSGANLTVSSNLYLNGVLEDLNADLGTTVVNNAVTSGPGAPGSYFTGGAPTNGWNLGNVTNWVVNGNLTNNGAIYGYGYGSISFNGTGTIAGTNSFTIPTMTVNGTYAIADNIIITTNTPTLNGTLIFDIVRTNKIFQLTFPTNTLASHTNLYYNGNLIVVNSGAAPSSGSSFQFFSCSNFAGAFASETFPSLPGGLSWVDKLLINGSIAVTGSASGAPRLTLSQNGAMLTLSWDSSSFPGYSVQAQTNSMGLHNNWFPTGSGTISPYMVTVDPKNTAVFYRLSHP